MPKVKGPLFSISAHGTMKGAITFQGSPSGPRVQKVPRHRDMRTAAQTSWRDFFVVGVTSWHELDAGSKAYYNTLAKGQGMTGYNLYMKLYLIGGLPPPPTPFSWTKEPGVGADDTMWWRDEVAFDSSLPTPIVGFSNIADEVDQSIRFPNCLIPAGATITVAYLKLWVNEGTGGTTDIRFYAEDAADPAAVSSAANGNSRVKTTEYYDWGLVGGAQRQSGSLVPIIQELVDSYDYSGGAHAIQFILYNLEPAQQYCHINHYESTGFEPELYVEGTTP